jgi:hypothetical protein
VWQPDFRGDASRVDLKGDSEMATYRITLSNSGGELDSTTTADEDNICDALIEMLDGCPLAAGDVIRITEVE